jgi:hypothetical protein
MKQTIIKILIDNVLKVYPQNKFFDFFYHFLKHFFIHKRFPKRNRLLYSDYLFKIKTSSDLLDPLKVFVSDKEFVKHFIKSIIGDEFNVPHLVIINKVEEISNSKLPLEYVIKPTHSSGQVQFISQKQPIDLYQIKKWLNDSYYTTSRELNYKQLKPKLIVEPLIFSNKNNNDYKVFCWKGIPKLIQVDIDRKIDHKRLIYNNKWQLLNITLGTKKILKKSIKDGISKPLNFELMLILSHKISSYFEFVRIDFYSNGNQLYIGELTNLPGGGFDKFISINSEKEFSDILFN